jgi:hypothetical protein
MQLTLRWDYITLLHILVPTIRLELPLRASQQLWDTKEHHENSTRRDAMMLRHQTPQVCLTSDQPL